MSKDFITLRHFEEHELIFDEQETREILCFFFPERTPRIQSAPITVRLRSFAQGLLVEAIDSSYALGYMQILVATYFNPGKGLKKALEKAGKKAAKHWFKHAKESDLRNAKVAEAVRKKLASAFATSLLEILDGVALLKPRATTLAAAGRGGSRAVIWS